MILLACAALALSQDPAAPTVVELGPWRAVLESPGGELPFGIEMRSDGADIVNGEEYIPVTRVTVDGANVLIEMEHYDSRIEAELSTDGKEMAGLWTKRSGAKTWAELPFHATAGEGSRFEGWANAGPGGRLSGRWSVDFSSGDDPAVAIFEEGAVDTVSGTFLTTTGDYRYLEGTFQGDTLKLSCFDGAHAFLFDAKLQDDGTLAGDFWSRDSWHDTWTARRDDAARLPDAFKQTIWNEGVSLTDLTFPDLDGTPRSLADPAFGGKAVLLQVFGTWCPNCYDETEYLVELNQRYKGRGLSIVGLAFELTGDFERNAEQVRRYKRRHNIEYPILIAGTSDKSGATEALTALDRVRSYPTTIFLTGDGKVRDVHTGFTGPATGPAYDHLREEFEQRIEELLAEESNHSEREWYWLVSQDWTDFSTAPGGDYRFFDDNGERKVLHRVHGSGRPILDTEALPVRIVGNALWIGDELWKIELDAEILTSPAITGARITPSGSEVPVLARAGSNDPADFVLRLKSKLPLERREALWALAHARRFDSNTRLTEALPLLEDPELEVRLMATWALGVVQEPDAVPALQRQLTSPNAALRRESVRALDWIGAQHAGARAGLEALADDPDPLVRIAVRRALE